MSAVLQSDWPTRQAAQERAIAAWMVACACRPLHTPAPYAVVDANLKRPTIMQTLIDASGYHDYDARLMHLLCDAAEGRSVKADALALLSAMAGTWAEQNVETVE